MVLTDRWRLLDGRKLYDLRSDPAQRVDVAENHPRIVQRLRDLYDPFWSSVSPRLRPVRIDIGNPAENPTRLCSQDWYLPNGNPPWNFNTIKKLPRVNGPWMLQVKQAGRYRFVLRQFPPESGKTVQAIRARLAVDDQAFESDVTPGSRGVSFVVKLEAGPCRLETYLFDRQGRSGGAYFTEVSKL